MNLTTSSNWRDAHLRLAGPIVQAIQLDLEQAGSLQADLVLM